MKKNKKQFLLAFLVLTMNSCCTEDTIIPSEKTEKPTNYKQDYDILKDYVRIDKTNQKYYLDFSQQEHQAQLTTIVLEHKKGVKRKSWGGSCKIIYLPHDG